MPTALVLAAALWPTLAQAQAVTVGTPGTQVNAFPFGGGGVGAYVAGSEYQELYSSTAFAGVASPFQINDIAFSSASGATTATYNVTLRLSTTRATNSTLSTNFAANEGADLAVVFNGTLTANLLTNGTFDLVFPTSPFVYTPSQGNLLLDVVLNQNTTTSSGNTAFFAEDGSGQTSRIYESSGNGAPTRDQNSLYTQFNGSPAPVPEASTTVSLGLLLMLGLGGLVIAGKRRKSTRRA